jgi:hypothetical protein
VTVARAVTCDGGHEPPEQASMMLTDLETGDGVTMCVECLTKFAIGLVGGLAAQDGDQDGDPGDVPPSPPERTDLPAEIIDAAGGTDRPATWSAARGEVPDGD